MNTNETPALPLFAQLLDGGQTSVDNGGTRPRPTDHCLDTECTKKWPSDGDDCYQAGW